MLRLNSDVSEINEAIIRSIERLRQKTTHIKEIGAKPAEYDVVRIEDAISELEGIHKMLCSR